MNNASLAEVEILLSQLTPEEQLTLVEHLAQRLRQALPKPRQAHDLYGIWRGRFPADFDIDASLGDIRRAWRQEWPEAGK